MASGVQDWVRLVERNDWGALYYTLPGEGVSRSGTVSFDYCRIDAQAGEIVPVRWPDGTVTEEKVGTRQVTTTVPDMGYSYTASSDRPFFAVEHRGLMRNIALNAVEVPREWAESRRVGSPESR